MIMFVMGIEVVCNGLWPVNVFGLCEYNRADDIVFVFSPTIIVLESDFKHEFEFS